MHTCAVVSCESSSHFKNVTFFRVPIKNAEEAKGWINFITEANSGVVPNVSPGRLYVCSKHFRKCCLYPCHPRRTTRVNGHFPSVVDGKVIFNHKSKCALVSPHENLQMFERPTYRNPQEKQRAYLVKQLTSFGEQKRKIVIGNGNEKNIMKKLNEKLCSENDTMRTLNKSVPTVPPSSPEESKLPSPKVEGDNKLSPIPNIPKVEGDNKLSPIPNIPKVEGDNKVSPIPNVVDDFKVHPIPKVEGDNHVCPISKIETDVKKEKKEMTKLRKVDLTSSRKKKLTKKSSFAKTKRTTPSSETKMILLKRDNANLKKSVFALEKKVEDMEKDIRKFRDASLEIETRSKQLLQNFQKRLKQKKRKVHTGKTDASTSTEVATNCKCASILFVDIAED